MGNHWNLNLLDVLFRIASEHLNTVGINGCTYALDAEDLVLFKDHIEGYDLITFATVKINYDQIQYIEGADATVADSWDWRPLFDFTPKVRFHRVKNVTSYRFNELRYANV